MRRPLVVLSSVASVTALACAIALPSTSAAPHSSRVVVCPLMRSVIIPCCGPPMAAQRQDGGIEPVQCCPVSIPCAAGLTISSHPNPSNATDKVVISGHMRVGTGATAAPVVLWQRLPGHARYERVLQTTVDTSGNYSIARRAGRVQTNRLWYVSAGAMRSVSISQHVRAIVKLRASFPKAARPGTVTFAGSVSPAHARELIAIERRSGGWWKQIAHVRLNRRSRFRARLHAFSGREVSVRAFLPADSRSIASVSAPVTIGTTVVSTRRY